MDPNQFSSLAVFISAAVAVTALFSQLITNFFNNRHQLKLKKLELSDKAARDNKELIRRVFEQYLSTTSGYLKVKANISAKEYGEAYGNILLYATLEESVMINHCDDLIQKRNLEEASELLRDIADNLRHRILVSNEAVK